MANSPWRPPGNGRDARVGPCEPDSLALVMLPPFQETAMDRPDRIPPDVTQATGHKVGIGIVPSNYMTMRHLSLSGGAEPATHLSSDEFPEHGLAAGHRRYRPVERLGSPPEDRGLL